ncbi:MRG-domain-containing protein [Dichotomocladium elegans]|nr:MRG-domain-containing protein [Dichotomocladium elegans]
MQTLEKDERILCFHGPLLYEAKIVKVDLSEDQKPIYLVHYKGWKQTWDEWVPEERVLKWNDTNLQKQQQLKDMHGRRKTSRSSIRTGHDGASITSSESRGRKRHRDQSTSDKPRSEDDNLWRQEFGLVIPESLKSRLVDDWENVTKNKELLPLPRQPSVSNILEQYTQYAREQRTMDEETLEQVVDGIRLYFEKLVGTLLLYQIEREQFEELRASAHGKSLCDIYGIEHFLRLFVQMPILMNQANVDPETLVFLRDTFADLLRFIQDHEEEYYS